MKTIAHISDLHFGREDPAVVGGLVRDLRGAAAVAGGGERRPHPARAGGRVPRRARVPRPPARARSLVVPGNHDIPLFNVVARWLAPARRATGGTSTPDPEPFFHDEDLAVMGVNTARPGKWKDGRLSERQIERIRERFGPIPERVFKVWSRTIPSSPPPASRAHALVGARASRPCRRRRAAGVDLLLAGHLHMGFTRRRAAALPVDPPLDAGGAGGHVDLRCGIAASPTPTTGSSSTRRALAFEQRGWNGAAFEPRGPSRATSSVTTNGSRSSYRIPATCRSTSWRVTIPTSVPSRRTSAAGVSRERRRGEAVERASWARPRGRATA